MSEQENQQRQEVPFAAAKASAARSAILRSSAELLTWRARVEKYLQADPQRARGCYEELQKVRTRLAAALGDARLALLELEEYAGAGIAGKLQAGLSGFNLMSRAYKPVYEALRGFAEKLPERPDTVNAKTIGRLMNQVRMGYYPTDPENIGHILRGIRFPEGVTTNVFDPCCGCGKALRQIAQGNNCFAYGVELDESRAEEAMKTSRASRSKAARRRPRHDCTVWAWAVSSTAASVPRPSTCCSSTRPISPSSTRAAAGRGTRSGFW